MQWLARRRTASTSDAGVTLIETLVALSILAIAGVAIMAGLQLAVKSSDIHRKQSTGGSAVRTYAEAIEKYLDADGNYVPCAGAGAYAPATVLRRPPRATRPRRQPRNRSTATAR